MRRRNGINPEDLATVTNPRGGVSSFKALKALGEQLVIGHVFASGNRTTIQFLRTCADIVEETPCHARIDAWNRDAPFAAADLRRVATCQTIYVVLPQSMAHSRAFDFREVVPATFPGKKIIFVGDDLSRPVREILAEVPNSAYIELREV